VKGFARANTPEAKISRTLLKIAERVLAGEIAARKGEMEAGIRALREALQLEATVPYSEPPFWFQPVRHNLGAVLLLAGRADEAETVYREDLRLNPENGWALHGLVHSLQAQQKDESHARARLDTAWAQADVTLTGSRF
jgi:tetratricopeptide (TPR) repeat protein